MERFVAELVSSQPLTAAELRERVKGIKDLALRRAEDLLSIAETRGLIERQKLPGRGGPVGFVRSADRSEGGES